MAHGAFCSFCSKIDDAIHVICEGRCLICSHCQRSHRIKSLLLRCLDQAVVNVSGLLFRSTQVLISLDALCPICSRIMAPNMISAIRRARKDSLQPEQLNSRDSLLYQQNTYVIQSLATVPKKPPKSRKLINDGSRSLD
jgi:hypothetical protein